MTEAEYEYECSRAELLGIEKPSREEFFSRQTENARQHDATLDDSEDADAEQAEVLHEQGENLRRVGGGLEELNSILSITQKKINHLKTVCGSFTSILKLQSGSNRSRDSVEDVGQSTTTTEKGSSGEETSGQEFPGENRGAAKDKSESGGKKAAHADVHSAVGSQVDKLDALIFKAENAEMSMSNQNKQMKSFLK